MTTRQLNKVLIAQEDLALGQGTTTQTRQDETVSVSLLDLAWNLQSFSELSALDVSLYKHATVHNSSVYNLYRYDSEETSTADDYNYVEPDEGGGRWVLVFAYFTGHTLVTTWSPDTDTMDITNVKTVETANTVATSYTNANGTLRDGQELLVLVKDGNTTINHLSGGSGQFSNTGAANLSLTNGGVYRYVLNNDIWIQV
jgi:hypothetical protein